MGNQYFDGAVVRAAFGTPAELDACGVEPGLAFAYDCCVEAGGTFFSPAPVVSVEELRLLQEPRSIFASRCHDVVSQP